jgi:hypothetical protein
MRNTCGNCDHVIANKINRAPGVSVWGCGKTGLVIPHHTEWDGKAETVTFWRVPMACPLDDAEVMKSNEKAPESDWVTLTA